VSLRRVSRRERLCLTSRWRMGRGDISRRRWRVKASVGRKCKGEDDRLTEPIAAFGNIDERAAASVWRVDPSGPVGAVTIEGNDEGHRRAG